MKFLLDLDQTSASLGFIERVKFELFEMYNFKPSQAWVFPTSEILFKSSSSFFKSKTQFWVVTICFKVIKLESSFKLFEFLFASFTLYWIVQCLLWLNLIDLNWNCGHLFHIDLKKGIFWHSNKKKKRLKKAQKRSIFQAFLDQDINSSSGNFIFFTQAWNRVAVIRDELYRSQVKLKLLAEVC